MGKGGGGVRGHGQCFLRPRLPVVGLRVFPEAADEGHGAPGATFALPMR